MVEGELETQQTEIKNIAEEVDFLDSDVTSLADDVDEWDDKITALEVANIDITDRLITVEEILLGEI